MELDQERVVKAFWLLGLVFAIIAAAGLLGVDALVAGWTATLPRGNTLWNRGTGLLDLVVLKEISNFLLGALLLLGALILLALRSGLRLRWPLLYLGLVQFITTVTADLAKPQFGRVRPWEADEGSGGAGNWFVGANSFPSGHTAFYAGLFLPLILLFPRWSLLLVIPPLFIAAARILSHDHYLSDVATSLALASAMTAALARLARKGL